MSETIIECDGKRFKVVGFSEVEGGEWILDTTGRPYQCRTPGGAYTILLPLEEEPPKTEKRKVMVSGWVNVYSNGVMGSIHGSKQESDLRGYGRIACIHIEREVEEGEGLEPVEPPKPSLLEAAKAMVAAKVGFVEGTHTPQQGTDALLALQDAIAREEASRG